GAWDFGERGGSQGKGGRPQGEQTAAEAGQGCARRTGGRGPRERAPEGISGLPGAGRARSELEHAAHPECGGTESARVATHPRAERDSSDRAVSGWHDRCRTIQRAGAAAVRPGGTRRGGPDCESGRLPVASEPASRAARGAAWRRRVACRPPARVANADPALARLSAVPHKPPHAERTVIPGPAGS